ncbi:MAG: DUF1385 domain-containing protein, partial [Chloroflexi bacterium]
MVSGRGPGHDRGKRPGLPLRELLLDHHRLARDPDHAGRVQERQESLLRLSSHSGAPGVGGGLAGSRPLPGRDDLPGGEFVRLVGSVNYARSHPLKAQIHPTYYEDAVVTCACGNTFTTGSTRPAAANNLSDSPHQAGVALRPGPASPASGEAKAEQPFFYGGQAVIEGVMMRGKRYYAVAVRLPTTKEIVVDRGELKAPIYTHPLWKLPFVRGLALIGEQLHLGMKSLIWSANVNAGSQNIEIGKKEITGSVAMAGVFALVIFIGLPLLLASFAVHRSGSFLFVLVEGLIRVGLVLGYLAAIALLPDVRRVFQYHG